MSEPTDKVTVQTEVGATRERRGVLVTGNGEVRILVPGIGEMRIEGTITDPKVAAMMTDPGARFSLDTTPTTTKEK